MPITLLHVGLMAPFVRPKKKALVSVTSFILVNLWLDSEAIYNCAMGAPLPGYDVVTHTFAEAITAVFIAFRRARALMASVGNPLHMGWMEAGSPLIR